MTKRTHIVLAVLLSSLAIIFGYLLGTQQQTALFASSNTLPIEFTAPVNAYPDGFLGTWEIGGYKIQATRKTDMTQLPKETTIGDLVHVRAHQDTNGLVADSLGLVEAKPLTVDIHGPVKKIQDGFWIIGDKRVKVLPKTRIRNVEGPPTGRIASVRAHIEGDVFVADAITLTTRDDEAEESEFIGELEDVQGSVWVISGVRVQVDDNISPPPIGTIMRVRGRMQANGTLMSTDLGIRPAEVRVKGWLVGQQEEHVWQVLTEDGQANNGQRMNVRIDSNAPVDERDGVMQAGAHVAIAGTTETTGEIRATYVRVLNQKNAQVVYLIGTLMYIPTGDRFAYPWTVDETQVWVTPATLSDKPLSAYRVGDRVAVLGARRQDGSMVARMISPSKR